MLIFCWVSYVFGFYPIYHISIWSLFYKPYFNLNSNILILCQFNPCRYLLDENWWRVYWPKKKISFRCYENKLKFYFSRLSCHQFSSKIQWQWLNWYDTERLRTIDTIKRLEIKLKYSVKDRGQICSLSFFV